MSESTLFVVDDDRAVRDSLSLLGRTAGLCVKAYGSAQSFLADYADEPGCLITDLSLPAMSGLELQARLRAQGAHLPVIVLTAHADVPAAVRALKAGAIDFLEKPFDPEALLALVQEAIAHGARERSHDDHRGQIADRLERLTPREREVMRHVVRGEPNKIIALELGISERTVEIHRGRVMRKMQVRALADLVALAQEAGERT